MSTELTKNLHCIVMRNGVQIWAEEDRVRKLMAVFGQPNAPQFIEYDGRFLNKADLVGVFSARDMEETTRRKNGEWKCDWGFWHNKGTGCNCSSLVFDMQRRDHSCDKCKGGYLVVDNGDAKRCSCWFEQDVEKIQT